MELIAVMGLPVTSERVVGLFGSDLERVSRDEIGGDLSYGDEGVAIGFREEWVLLDVEPSDSSRTLYLVAAFLHSDGYEGHCEYRGELPGGARFGDTAGTVMQKLGAPTLCGGGDAIPGLGITPPWIKYVWRNYTVHFQFGRDRGLELVTLGCGEDSKGQLGR